MRCVVVQAACVQFYKRFIQCPNFMAWFERRRGAAAAWQVTHVLHWLPVEMFMFAAELTSSVNAEPH